MSQILQKTIMFETMPVRIFKKDHQLFMTGEELGRCLGYSDPTISVSNIFNRHKDELEPHTLLIKLISNSQGAPTRLYSEVGCYLVSMFARTSRAKAVRLWLATLPARLRVRPHVPMPFRYPEKQLRLSTGDMITYAPQRSALYASKKARFEECLRANMTGKEIARELGISVSTVYQWIRKIRMS